MKKSQVTLFIVLGIVIIVTIVLVIYFMSMKKPAPDDNLEKVKADITNFVDTCISQQSILLLTQLAEGGGSLTPTNIASQTASETILSPPTLFDAERVLEDGLDSSLSGCINLDSYRNEGYKIDTSAPQATARIGKDTVVISVRLSLNISKGGSESGIDSFTETINHPYRELYDIAIDLLNEETTPEGADKERIMLDHPGISIELHRPYPDTEYKITKSTPTGQVVWNMRILGRDTAGREVLQEEKPSKEICVDNVHGECYQNMDSCTAPLERGTGTACSSNAEKKQYGCCIKNGACEYAEKKSDCSGVFEDKPCDQLSCPNFDCSQTYNAKEGTETGEPRLNSESWCMYESRPGWGRDYVGTRHYKHSCINGQEYIEECRDFREELCTRDTFMVSGSLMNRAECKTNRWYDCTLQDERSLCLDTSKRDCMWMEDFFSPWYSKNNCVPFVPPGFRFWEGEGAQVCNQGSENPPSAAKKYPKTWSYGNFLSCIRLGDCGNYRNAADRITEGGYFHPLGKPEPWVYWDNGWIYDGGDFGITELSGKYEVTATSIPGSANSGMVTCALWEAPWDNTDCELCSKDPKRPCTEYKCMSLGRCYYDDGKCTKQPVPKSTFKIKLDKAILSPGFSSAESKSDYYPDTTKAVITPDVPSYSNFTFGIISDREARCRLSLRPPLVSEDDYANLLGAGFYPTLWMSDATPALKHNITLRLPAPDTSKMLMPRWQIFVLCTDNEGNSNEDYYLDLNVAADTTSKPRVLGIDPAVLISGRETDVEVMLDRPFSACNYGTAGAMQDLGCMMPEMEFSMDFGFVYMCRTKITIQDGASFDCVP